MNLRFASLLLLFLATVSVAAQTEEWRSLEIETTQSTAADVSVSPDGKRLVFTLLGHLFLVPFEGGNLRLRRRCRPSLENLYRQRNARDDPVSGNGPVGIPKPSAADAS